VAGNGGRSSGHCDEQRRVGVSEKKMKVSLICSMTARIRVSRRAHVGSNDRRCMVTVESLGMVSHALYVNQREPFKWPRRLTSGPRFYFIFSKIFNHLKFEIRIGDLLDVQNSPNFAGRQFDT
jgi:hypothetical protein